MQFSELTFPFSKNLQSVSYERILASLLSFINNIDFDDARNLQTAVLLTGVNQTDHFKQFVTLSKQIANNCPSTIVILQSRDCPTVKSAVESLVDGIINQDDEAPHKFKKNQLTLPVLKSWFDHRHGSSEVKPTVVIMLADFEQFNVNVMQELISILCSYTDRLPFVLLLGIATAFKALHNVLPSNVTNRMDVNVFQSDSSTEMLNKILDEVILTHRSPFQLSGKSFKILMDIFLFYDYSLHSFLNGYKMFMLEHFFTRPLSANFNSHKFDGLSHEDCETIRRSSPSFRAFVEAEENPETRIELITSDSYLMVKLRGRMLRLERYWAQFFCHLRILAILLEDLPRNELGKLLRELYPICVASDVTTLDEYKECFKLLRFTSKEKFLAKLEKILEVFQLFDDDTLIESQKKNLTKVEENILYFYDKIKAAGMSPQKEAAKAPPTTPKTPSETIKKGAASRQEMMEKLKESAKNNPTRVLTAYERCLWDCLEYMNGLMQRHLQPVSHAPPFHEFTVFTDCQSVRRQIVGAPRGALHNALSNSQFYLQCECCAMPENEQILPTLPDIAIAYKLHLECNKFINLYDWLQAFAMVIETNEDEDDISPEIQ